MNSTYEERREHKRILFSFRDEIIGVFVHTGDINDLLTLNVMNISEGGIGITYKREINKKLRRGDRLLLKKITGPKPLDSISNVTTQIQWILDNHYLDHIGFGCKFLNIPETIRDRIRELVEERFEKNTVI